MKIYIGADYRGFGLKSQIIDFLANETDHEVIDQGVFNPDEDGDFNDPAIAVAKSVREHGFSDGLLFGILICDSAHGMTIQANRFKGVRATYCVTPESAQLAREHEDANVLCLSSHLTDIGQAKSIITTFLETNFTNLERRVRRINRLDEREDYD